jgi:hypothetical protein
MALEEARGLQPSSGHFIFPEEINDVIFPNAWNTKQLRKLYP